MAGTLGTEGLDSDMQTYENDRLASHCGSITCIFMEPNAFPGTLHVKEPERLEFVLHSL